MDINDRFKRLIQPPHIGDDEQLRIASILGVSAIAILLGLSLLIIYRIASEGATKLAPFVLMYSLSLVSIGLVRRGKIALSANVLAWALFSFFTFMIVTHDGIHDAAVLALPGMLVNPATSIKYQVPSIENVSLKVFDILGNEVATLVNEQKEPGNYEVEFNASYLPSGIYFYKLVSGSYSDIRKMILLK